MYIFFATVIIIKRYTFTNFFNASLRFLLFSFRLQPFFLPTGYFPLFPGLPMWLARFGERHRTMRAIDARMFFSSHFLEQNCTMKKLLQPP